MVFKVGSFFGQGKKYMQYLLPHISVHNHPIPTVENGSGKPQESASRKEHDISQKAAIFRPQTLQILSQSDQWLLRYRVLNIWRRR